MDKYALTVENLTKVYLDSKNKKENDSQKAKCHPKCLVRIGIPNKGLITEQWFNHKLIHWVNVKFTFS